MQRLRVWLILGMFLIVPWIFQPFLFHPSSNLLLRQTVIECVVLLILALWVYDRQRTALSRGAIPFAMVLYVICSALSWIGSEEREASSLRLIWLLLMAVYAWTLEGLPSLFRSWRWAVLILSTALSLCSVMQYLGADILNLQKLTFNTVSVTLTHRNILASVLICTVPVVVHLWLQKASPRRFVLLSAALHVLLLAVLLTHTRGAWLALTGALILMAVLTFRYGGAVPWRSVVRGRELWAGLLILLLLPVSLSLVNQSTPIDVGTRLRTVVDVGDPNVQFRIATWKCGWDNFRDHSVLGSGVGTFRAVFMKYQGPYLKGAARHEDLSPYAHNDYVEVLSDTGLLGLLAFLAMIGVVYAQALRFLRRSPGPTLEKTAVIVLISVLTTVVLHSVTHYGFHEAIASLFFWSTIGMIGAIIAGTSTVRTKPAMRRSSGMAMMPILMPVLVLAGWQVVIPPMISESLVERGTAELNRQMGREGRRERADYSEAARIADEAITYDARNSFAYYLKANVLNKWGKKEEAIEAYNRALQIRPYNHYFLTNRGITYYELGDLDKALADLDRALTIHPNLSNAYLHRGEIYFKTGRPDDALRNWEEAVLLNDPAARELKGKIEGLRGRRP